MKKSVNELYCIVEDLWIYEKIKSKDIDDWLQNKTYSLAFSGLDDEIQKKVRLGEIDKKDIERLYDELDTLAQIAYNQEMDKELAEFNRRVYREQKYLNNKEEKEGEDQFEDERLNHITNQ